MRLIDADTAEAGLMVLANAQTSGKGQRGKQWVAAAGDSLLMSLILRPNKTLQQQTEFLAAVAVAVAQVCEENLPRISVEIKWPNDIIIADKKAGGILIENVIRGTSWEWSVIGIGINVQQRKFSNELPFATSLAANGAKVLELKSLAISIREQILIALLSKRDFLLEFNTRLYQRDAQQLFKENAKEFWGRVVRVDAQGLLHVVLDDGQERSFVHGEVEWVW